MGKITIRNMELKDIDAVDKIRQKSWLDSYVNEGQGVTADLINDYFDYRLKKVDRAEKVARILSRINNPSCFYKVATDKNKKVVGFIFAEKTSPTQATLGSLYLEPSYIGKGNGRLLMDGFIDWLGSRVNCDLFVVGYNKRAIDFYKKYGFEISSNKPTKEAHLDDTHPLVDKMKVIRMTRKTN